MIGDNVTEGYDWHVMRDLPPAHGMGKSTKPDPNRKITYPQVLHVICLDSHNTSFFYKREDGTYYWHHSRKDRDDVEVDADQIQLDLFDDPILSKEFIMKSIL